MISICFCGPLSHKWEGHKAWRTWEPNKWGGQKLVDGKWVKMSSDEACQALHDHLRPYHEAQAACPCYEEEVKRQDQACLKAGAWQQVKDRSLVPEEHR